MSSTKKQPKSKERRRNRVKELIEAFGTERGIVMALNISVESCVYYGEKSQQKWLDELKRCRIPDAILADAWMAVLRIDKRVMRSAEVVEMTPQYRAYLLRKHRVAAQPA